MSPRKFNERVAAACAKAHAPRTRAAHRGRGHTRAAALIKVAHQNERAFSAWKTASFYPARYLARAHAAARRCRAAMQRAGARETNGGRPSLLKRGAIRLLRLAIWRIQYEEKKVQSKADSWKKFFDRSVRAALDAAFFTAQRRRRTCERSPSAASIGLPWSSAATAPLELLQRRVAREGERREQHQQEHVVHEYAEHDCRTGADEDR